jgi:hypothetical protein
MRRSLIIFVLGAISCTCFASSPIRTFADVEAALARLLAEWQRSQLTDHPKQTYIPGDLRFHLFYQLPLAERAVVVMERFANAEFDGEVGFMMGQMLRYRKEPGFAGATVDPAYTTALFHAIESYSEAQVRRFCSDDAERYARFRRNLRHWKAQCHIKA